MHTSAEIAETLHESAVMVRRCFLLLHDKGLIEQRKGPHGGARLKVPPKEIGLGDVYAASETDWLQSDDPSMGNVLKRVRDEGLDAMNETTLAQVVKKMRKNAAHPEPRNGHGRRTPSNN